MIIEKPSTILPDNEEAYFSLLEGVISSVDDLATLSINRGHDDWKFRVIPSHPSYIEDIIKQITTLNSLFKIHVLFSKSIKSASTITFSISLT